MPELEKTGQPETNKPQETNESAGGPGALLMAGREKLGLTQKQVAQSLHLRLTSIQAIERDELEEGVSLTFTKGYVRLYAKLVKLDAQPLLDAHDKLHVKQTQPTKLQSFSRRTTRETHDSRWNVVSIIVVLLLLGSLVVWWVDREGYFNGELVENNPPVQTSTPSANSRSLNSDVISEKVEEPNIQGPDVDDLDADEVADERIDGLPINETLDAAQSDQIATLPLPENAAQSEVASLTDNTDANDSNAETLNETADDTDLNDNLSDTSQLLLDSGYQVNDDGTVEVVFTFADDCWVSVKDAYGEIMAIGVKDKGRVMQVSGVPPIAIILGAPQAVAINFGGVDIDMAPYPSSSTANFSLPVASD